MNSDEEWRTELRCLLGIMGHGSLTSYARRRPYASLLSLSRRLGAGAITPLQLQATLLEEAAASDTIEIAARDLLVRTIHCIPYGWPWPTDLVQRNFTRTALNDWVLSLAHPSRDLSLRAVAQALATNRAIPVHWKPVGAWDPILNSTFNRHWKGPRAAASSVWPVLIAAEQ